MYLFHLFFSKNYKQFFVKKLPKNFIKEEVYLFQMTLV